MQGHTLQRRSAASSGAAIAAATATTTTLCVRKTIGKVGELGFVCQSGVEGKERHQHRRCQ